MKGTRHRKVVLKAIDEPRSQEIYPPGEDPGIEVEIKLTRGLQQFATADHVPFHHVLFLMELDTLVQDVSPAGTGQTIDTPDQWRAVYAALKTYL